MHQAPGLQHDRADDFRLPATSVLAALTVGGWTLAFLSQFWTHTVEPALLGLALMVCSGFGLLIASRYVEAGQWFSVVMPITVLIAGYVWLGEIGFLALLPVPVMIGVAVIGPIGGLCAAALESLILAVMSRWRPEVSPATVGTSIIAPWPVLAIAWAVCRKIGYLSAYVSAAFDRAQQLAAEVQGRRAQLEQAMADLTHVSRQLALANERIQMLRQVAEEARKAKAMFVASVSHEFRTPLNMIIGLVSLMVDSPEVYDSVISPEMRSDLEVIRRNCDHLARMINDVLSLTQAEVGQLALRKQRVNIREVITDAVEAVRPLVEKKGLTLSVEVPNDLPEVYCDSTRIEQVILNLLSNAARFTTHGGITVCATADSQEVTVQVADTGPGIEPQLLEHVFEPFYKGEVQAGDDKGGSGLGLTISRQFVRLHGGRMWVESELGKGSSFFFTLPISPPIEPVARAGHQIVAEWSWRERPFRPDRTEFVRQLTRPRLVVCDRSGALVRALSQWTAEIELVEAQEPAQIASVLAACPAHAIVLNTPEPQQLWPQVRELQNLFPDTPVVGFCTSCSPEYASEAGAVAYLTKPVTRDALKRVVEPFVNPGSSVLIVDDDADVIGLFTRLLKASNSSLTVLAANGGERALECLARTSVDLILLDVVLPGMSGWDVLRQLRQDERTRFIPVVMVSAQDPLCEPPRSECLVAAVGGGLSVKQMVRSTLALSNLLLASGDGVDPTLARTPEA